MAFIASGREVVQGPIKFDAKRSGHSASEETIPILGRNLTPPASVCNGRPDPPHLRKTHCVRVQGESRATMRKFLLDHNRPFPILVARLGGIRV